MIKYYEKLRLTIDSSIAAYAKKISELILKLHSNYYVHNIFSHCKILFEKKDFETKLDINPNLLGFTNGVYNLNNFTFRNGTTSDFISLTTGYDYDPENLENFDKVIKIVEDILPDPEMRENFLKVLAFGLSGTSSVSEKCTNKLFSLINADGVSGMGTGKSTIMGLFKESLGDYGAYCDTRFLSEIGYNLSKNNLFKNKRSIIILESDNTTVERIPMRLMSDQITNQRKYLITNDANCIKQIKNSLIIFPFDTPFVKTLNIEDDPKKKLVDPTILNDIKNLKKDFMIILLDHWKLLSNRYFDMKNICAVQNDKVSWNDTKY